MSEPHVTTWALPGGEARLDRASGLWWRPGLDRPVRLASVDDMQLVPTLEVGARIAHLAEPFLLSPGDARRVFLAWPVAWTLRVGDRVLDAFRPGLREAVLGPLSDGRLLPAASCALLAEDDVPPDGHARLALTLQHRGATPATVRRVAFDERGLTLARHDGRLFAGDLVVDVHAGDHAASTCAPAVLPAGAEILREGDAAARGGQPSGLRWWIDATRRSMGFSL